MRHESRAQRPEWERAAKKDYLARLADGSDAEKPHNGHREGVIRKPDANINIVEEAVIKACMLDLKPWLHDVTSEHFSCPKLQEVWLAVDRLRSDGREPDILEISKEMRKSDALEKIGGDIFLMEIGGNIPPAVIFSVESNCRALIELYNDRESKKEMASIVKNPALSKREKLDALERIRDLIDAKDNRDWHEGTTTAKEFLGWEGEQEKVETMPFGLPTIDRLLEGGIKRGQYVILGARPGSGKTTIGMNLMRRLSQKLSVLYVTFEMSRFRIMKSLLAGKSRKLLQKISDGEMKITFIDSGREISGFRNNVLKILEKKDIDLIIVDHFHLLRGKGDNAEGEYRNTSQTLQRIAQEEDVAVLALAQLNRDAAGKPPKEKDLRGSGSIEEDADVVLLMSKEEKNETLLRLAKNRDTGEEGACRLVYNPESRELSEKSYADNSGRPGTEF